jgi:hypothetical protein
MIFAYFSIFQGFSRRTISDVINAAYFPGTTANFSDC